MTEFWESKTLYDRIIDRLTQADQKYDKFNTSRDVITELFRPDLGVDTDAVSSSDGDFFGDQIYEGTAPWAARVMATGFQGNLVSKSIDWFMYQMKQSELRGIDELDIWCQNVKEHMTGVYQDGNFYDVQPNFTLNGLTIGSPVMFIEENISEGRIMFIPQHYKHCFLCYDKYNQVEGLIVKDTEWTAKQVFDTFIGEYGENRNAEMEKKLSLALVNAIKSGEYNTKATVIRAIFKDTDPIWKGDKFKKPVGNFKWVSVYFEYGTDKDKNEPLQNEGYFTKPFVHWDYDKKGWESASRTPAFDAIWDCRSHQQVHKNFLENMQMKNRPPRVALRGMRNKLKLSPEGLMFVEPNEYDKPPKAVDLIGDIQLNKELSDIFSEALKRHFHLDLFQLFTSVAAQRKQPLTATQIWQMAGEKATLLSPAVETHSQYLKDTDDRCIDIEARAGRGPFAPDEMGNIIDIITSNSNSPVRSIGLMLKSIGPLARAQKMQQALDTIQSGLAAASPLLTIYPDLAMSLKEYNVLEDIFQATNFPMKNLKTEEEYQALLDAVNQQRAQQAQAQMTIEAMKASKAIQGPVDPNSVMAGAGKVLAGAA